MDETQNGQVPVQGGDDTADQPQTGDNQSQGAPTGGDMGQGGTTAGDEGVTGGTENPAEGEEDQDGMA